MMVKLAIYQRTVLEDELVNQSYLDRVLPLSTATIKKATQALFDQGVLTAQWEQDPKTGRWSRPFRISNEFKKVVEDLYHSTVRYQQKLKELDEKHGS